MGQRRWAGVLVADGAKFLDVAGPSEVVSEAELSSGDYELLLSSAVGSHAASSARMRIAVDAAAADAGLLDTALASGGDASSADAVRAEVARTAGALAGQAQRVTIGVNTKNLSHTSTVVPGGRWQQGSIRYDVITCAYAHVAGARASCPCGGWPG
jgi:transcriptional regulator GlxA family with amidase domain